MTKARQLKWRKPEAESNKLILLSVQPDERYQGGARSERGKTNAKAEDGQDERCRNLETP